MGVQPEVWKAYRRELRTQSWAEELAEHQSGQMMLAHLNILWMVGEKDLDPGAERRKVHQHLHRDVRDNGVESRAELRMEVPGISRCSV